MLKNSLNKLDDHELVSIYKTSKYFVDFFHFNRKHFYLTQIFHYNECTISPQKKKSGKSNFGCKSILVGIVISAAGVYASGIMDQISTTTQNSRISIKEVQIIQDDNEREWFVATIKNEGGTVIKHIQRLT